MITFIVDNKRNYSKGNVVGDNYFLDCTVTIQHEFSNEVTQHAVEDGTPLTDHIQRLNNTFTVDGIFNKWALNKYNNDSLSHTDRVNKAYKFLRDLRDNREVFTLVSSYEVFPNCVITNLSIPVGANDGDGLFFNMAITQIRTSNVSEVAITKVVNIKEYKQDSASTTSNSGKTSSDVKTKNNNESILYSSGLTARDLIKDSLSTTPDEKMLYDLMKGRE